MKPTNQFHASEEASEMSQKPFKLAMIQMRVTGGEKAQNVQRAARLIADAASGQADLVLLPECMDLGWTHPSASTQAEPITEGSVYNALCESAVMHGVYVCAGLTERAGECVFNSAVLISPDGKLLLQHRKLNELDIAHDLYEQGDRLRVAKTEFGTLGLMICADAFANDQILSRSLCYMGADVILSPSSWAVPPDHDHAQTPYGNEWLDAYQAVAKAFSVSIIGVSNVGPVSAGPWQGWKCIGCSLAIGPDGEALLQGPYGQDSEEIMYVDINPLPRPTRGTGWAER